MRALVAGTISLDLLAASATSTEATATVGSTGANIAIRLAAKGWRVELVGLVGNDEPGRLVRAELEAWGVDTSRVTVRAGTYTPIVYQVSGVPGDPFLRRCPRCHRPQARHELPSEDELAEQGARSSDLSFAVIDCGGEALSRIVGEARERSALLWVEFSPLRNSEPIGRDILESAWVVKTSEEDAPLLDDASVCGWVTHQGPVLSIVTLGERGVRVRRSGVGEPWKTYSAVRLQGPPIDPIGAGDAFTAACLDGFASLGTPFSSSSTPLDGVLVAALREAAAVVTVAGANGDLVRPSGASPGVVPFACYDCNRSHFGSSGPEDQRS